MKYKLRYTIMTLALTGLLGWDLAYEAQKPDMPIASAAATSTVTHTAAKPHPVVKSLKQLIAPGYVPPPAPQNPPIPAATSTDAASTPPAASSTPPAATSTAATSTPPITIPGPIPHPLPLPIRLNGHRNPRR